MQITSSKASSMPFSLLIFSLQFSLHCTLTTCISYLNYFFSSIKYTYGFSLSLSLPFRPCLKKSAVLCFLSLSTASLPTADCVTFQPATAEILIFPRFPSSTETTTKKSRNSNVKHKDNFEKNRGKKKKKRTDK